MSQSKDNLDEEWRKVFEEASETPPPAIWDAIEKHLDEQNRVPVLSPLWKQPRVWLTAASVLLMLGIGSVIMLTNHKADWSGEEIQLGGISTENHSDGSTNEPHSSIAKAAETFSELPEGKPTHHVKVSPGTIQRKSGEELASSTPRPAPSVQRPLASQTGGNTRSANPSENEPGASLAAILQTERSALAAKASEDSPSAPLSMAALTPIAPQSVEEIETHWQTRYVFFNPYLKAQEEEAQPMPEASQLWAGIAMMPGGFNPNMRFSHQNVYQMNHALANTNSYAGLNSGFGAKNRAETGNRDQPKISYQASAQVGFQLTKNWSLESGIAFLQGNSTSRSPGYYLSGSTLESADLLANALVAGSNAYYSRETVDQLQLRATESNALAVYVPRDQNMSNRYSFLQVPAYVGYTFRPEKKFSYALLAGGIANLFLKNELETTSGYTLKTTPENNVYTNTGVAAAAGLRVNYRMSQAWNTSLTTNYQHSLVTSFRDNQFLKAYPKVYGISWGVRYTFQK
jgi:hypothetical protein